MEILKGNDMTTAEIINQAVKMINEHDFFWFYADYEATAREAAVLAALTTPTDLLMAA